MPFDLRSFGLVEMLRCGGDLRRLGGAGETLEDAAGSIVRYLYHELRDGPLPDDARSCPLVRMYKTHPYADLPRAQQAFASGIADAPLAPDTPCLTLLASAGDQREWNARERSRGHQAIPLTDAEAVLRAPMIAQLIEQFGLEVAEVLAPSPALLPRKQRGAGKGQTSVFHVPEAIGSPAIPAQAEFVIPYGIHSVLGFGGLLRSGELFAVILFSRTPISVAAAGRFRALALDLRSAFFGAGDRPTFRVEPAASDDAPPAPHSRLHAT